ncbi:MAG: Flp pilus assembly complex ATPase component TadA [Fimbriimonadaceae bacterium]|nr:Flp pilus assembly complex ATPase component TadA [Fimbriimonadaceae bacterium]
MSAADPAPWTAATLLQRLAADPHSQLLLDRGRLDGTLRLARGDGWELLAELPSGAVDALQEALAATVGVGWAGRDRPWRASGGGEVAGGWVSVALSFLPGPWGGRLSVRSHGGGGSVAAWEQLALPAAEEAALRRLLQGPPGLLAVVGPSGSGKTTLLWALLRELAGPTVNAVAVADHPCPLPHVTTALARGTAGCEPGELLAALAADPPQVVATTDLADPSAVTAALAMGLQGSRVLANLAAADSVAAIGRLLQREAVPYLLSDLLRGVLASRLVRCVCAACAREVTLRSPAAAARLGLEPRGLTHRAGAGCPACGGSGYRGRRAVYEVVEVSAALAAIIADGARPDLLREQAFAAGNADLTANAAALVLAGVTTPEEAARALGRDHD